MKREIRFRAKSLEGELIYFELHESRKCGDPEVFYVEDIPCEPGTEEQFIGLLDKQGNEIYEGDILDCTLWHDGANLPHRGEMVYSNTHCSFGTKNEAGITLFCKHNVNTREVIGNIHENPELK